MIIAYTVNERDKNEIDKKKVIISIPASEDGKRLQINDSSLGWLFSFLK